MKTIQEVKDFFFAQLNVPAHAKEHKARILEKLAREILLRNETIIIDGTVKWFRLRRMGLGVYEISLNELKSTELLKD
jgi:hypothetical protein